MKKNGLLTILGLAFISLLFAATALAQGGGYTDCERDPVYSKNFTAKPKISLNLRQRACMSDSPVIGVLSPNQNYQIIAETDGWYKIQLSNGTTGWAGSGLMTKISEDTGNNEKLDDTGYKTTAGEDVEKKETYSETTKVNAKIQERVKGYILLQVESAGEAWYVNPVDGGRYYMKDGDAAYQMMRNFGLGINNSNLAKLKRGDLELTNNLKGRIILAVEENGEAYYIHPKDGSVHYLKNGQEAYKIMKYLSLGITNSNLNQVPLKDKIEYLYKNKNSAETKTSASNGTISLSGNSSNNKVYLNWTKSGLSAENGFKVVTSQDSNPVYPGNDYHYFDKSSDNSDTWTNLTAGKTYHFRVCEYLSGKCGTYSNDVAITVIGSDTSEDSNSGSISLTGYKNAEGKIILNWTLSDMTSENGFKIVYSLTENPVYPGNTYHYLSDKNLRSDTWSELTAGKTYHFRVCEYLGGKCGIYSNDLEIAL